MTARDRILNKLRAAQQPFTEVPPLETYHHFVTDLAGVDLAERFTEEAGKLGCKVTQHADAESALDHLMTLLRGESALISWDFAHIPLPGLAEALSAAGVAVIPASAGKAAQAAVRVGLTGVNAAIASTGSLVVTSGAGRGRGVSLLPPVHVAVIRRDQLVPDFETWANTHPDFQTASNHAVITGPSRTADIAMEVVMGVHGPGEIHLLLL